jgi:hypothetical protein
MTMVTRPENDKNLGVLPSMIFVNLFFNKGTIPIPIVIGTKRARSPHKKSTVANIAVA